MDQNGWGPPEQSYRYPTPWVTHQDLGPIHGDIGRLKHGQQSLEVNLGSIRAEMLTRLDQISRQIDAANASQSKGGLSFSIPQLATLVGAILLAGAMLGQTPMAQAFLAAQ